MTTNNVFKVLADKKFGYYYFGEFESKCSFINFLKILAIHSDFFNFSDDEQKAIANEWLKKKEIYIDADRSIKIY